MNGESQGAAILRLLVEARSSWVSLPEILALGIAQYNARIFELRRLGFAVENKTETDPRTSARHSWFRLVNPSSVALSDPKVSTASPVSKSADYESATGKSRPLDPPPSCGPLSGASTP
jgi:hypothetical protein